MNEQYQKVAYIGLRKKDGSYAINIPLYVKLDEVDKKDMDESREEIIHKVAEIMIRRYEKQLVETTFLFSAFRQGQDGISRNIKNENFVTVEYVNDQRPLSEK